MKVRGIQYILTVFINPFFFRESLSHRTASITTGVVMDLKLTTILAYADISTIGTSLAVDDTVSDFGLL